MNESLAELKKEIESLKRRISRLEKNTMGLEIIGPGLIPELKPSVNLPSACLDFSEEAKSLQESIQPKLDKLRKAISSDFKIVEDKGV